MTPKTPVPARLWVYIARNAPVGVILRRGPGDWIQMIHWNTQTDVFTLGHWIKGRIWTRRSDVSPDGQLLIYAYNKPHKVLYNPERFPIKADYGGAWTAISKPPYFTALALWPNNAEGGFFVDNRTIYVYRGAAHPDHEPQGLSLINQFNYLPNGVDTDWFERHGWLKINSRTSDDVILHNNRPFFGHPPFDLWRKDIDDFGFSLYVKDMKNSLYFTQKASKRPGRRNDDYLQYGVVKLSTNQDEVLEDVFWADFDQQKRLVLARAGKLFSAAVVDGELALTELADFNANQPEAIESPDWAKRW